MFKRCNHDWVKVSEVTLPSAFEQAVKVGTLDKCSGGAWFYRKTYILILRCTLCGNLDKTIAASKTFE